MIARSALALGCALMAAGCDSIPNQTVADTFRLSIATDVMLGAIDALVPLPRAGTPATPAPTPAPGTTGGTAPPQVFTIAGDTRDPTATAGTTAPLPTGQTELIAALAEAERAWPMPTTEWRRVRALLDQSQRFGEPAEAGAALRAKLQRGAPDAFASYALLSEPNFFSVYPLSLDPAAFHAQNPSTIARYSEARSTEDLQRVLRTYGAELPAAARSAMAQRYYAAAVTEAGPASPVAALAAIEKTRSAGFPVDPFRVVLADATPARGTASPVQFLADLGTTVQKLDLDAALAAARSADADFLLVLDAAAARPTRRVTGNDTVESAYLAGMRTVANPAYQVAEAEVARARLRYDDARVRFPALINEAGRALDNALGVLGRTPPTTQESVYRTYSFRRTSIESRRAAAVTYTIVDRRAGTYVQGTFEVGQTKTFRIGYDIHADDPLRARHMADLAQNRDIAAFEDGAFDLPLSDVLERAKSGTAATFADATVLRDRIRVGGARPATPTATAAATPAPTYGVVTAGDRRFDSVVAIYTGEGALGTGFYVAEDIVLTNEHVVEGTQFVEIELFNGATSFGRVIATDIGLDLALVQVQARGEPLTFYAEPTLPLGATLEAIGHPEGLGFSLTRGILSQMREISPKAGMPRVRYIQTDAAINHGNSGGPLFLGQRVVGVNTWGVGEAEALNFAVHYGEVFEFLAQHRIQPKR